MVLLADQADKDGEKAGTFHKRADDDGGEPVMISLFRLAGTGFKSGLTDITDTESGGDSGDTRSQGRTGLTERSAADSLKNHRRE